MLKVFLTRNGLTLGILAVIYLILSLILMAGDPTYEGGTYKFYLLSMLQDGDFNIINQVQPSEAWIATRTYFHPSHHLELYSALLFPFYIIERGIFSLTDFRTHFYFDAVPGSLALNFFCLVLTVVLLRMSFKKLGLELSRLTLTLFYFGSVLFFFSFFMSTVPEILVMPSLAYCFLLMMNLKTDEQDFPVFSASLNISFLLSQKMTFWPIPLYLLILFFIKRRRSLGLKEIMVLVIPGIIFFGTRAFNQYLKYGEIMNPQYEIYSHYTDPHLLDSVLQFFTGFLPHKGIFRASPLLLLALIGFAVYLYRTWQEKKFSVTDLAMMLASLFIGLFMNAMMIGDIGENRISGRIILSAFPFMLIGLTYLMQRYRDISFRLFSFVLCLWSVAQTLIHISIDSVNSYLYSSSSFPDPTVLSQGLTKYAKEIENNTHYLLSNAVPLSLFFITVALIAVILARFRATVIWNSFLIFSTGTFIVMTVLNGYLSGPNVEKLKKTGFYDTRVIGNGSEIYMLDYYLDYFKSLKLENDPKMVPVIDQRIDHYYDIVKSQVIRSTPEFDEALRTHSHEFSKWIRTDSDGR